MKRFFEVGDLVFLKSGSPEMTVIHVCTGNVQRPISTVWFINGVKCEECFPEETLTRAVQNCVSEDKP